MKMRLERTFGKEDKALFLILPLIAINIVEGKWEFAIGWIGWVLTFKSE